MAIIPNFNPVAARNIAGGFHAPKTMPLAPNPLSHARHFDGGGGVNIDDFLASSARRSNLGSIDQTGLLNSSVAGRTDQLNRTLPSGAYVVPADVVSGLGEGNTLSGAAVIDRMFHSNPYGIEGSKGSHGSGVGIPRPPAPFNPNKQPYAKGGTTGKVPVVVAGGEHVIMPEDIIRKFGSLKRGHSILDNFVVHVRKKTAKELMALPNPVSSRVKK